MAETAADRGREDARLLDEIEQLRTSLENSMDENARLAEDRDRLLKRVTTLSRDLQGVHHLHARVADDGAVSARRERANNTEEELRVAIEELQVLTEELEVANASLQSANYDLDARVGERTRELQQANSELQATEASFQALANLVPDLLWRSDAAGDASWFNHRWFAQTGQSEQAPLGLGWVEALHPLDRAVARADWSRSVANGEPFEREVRIGTLDTDYRWFLIRAEAQRDLQGRIRHWFAAGTDIHDQRVALDALRRSELRFRTLVEGMPQLAWRAVDGGQWTWASPQWSDYTGFDHDRSGGYGWIDAFHPDDRDTARMAWRRAQDAGALEFEGRIIHAGEQRHRHFRTLAKPVRDIDGRIIEWLGTSTDVDDLLNLRQQQAVLVAELQHRTRNLLAVVQAITLRTLKGSQSLEHFRACIDDRLQALSRVQWLLSRREGSLRVAFDALLREELLAHVELDEHGKGEQVSIVGPPGIPLRSAVVQTLALAIHELATNAVKYGALSGPDGHLDVSWVVNISGEERRLVVDWRESGVSGMPDAAAPARGGGYGRELIERALPYQLGARTWYQFNDDGVHCIIDLAVPADEHVAETLNA